MNIRNFCRRAWFLLLTLCLTQAPLFAAPLAPQDVPEPLKPWMAWVLHGQEEQRCPFLYNNGDQHRCGWPSRLELKLGDQGGTFSQQWLILTDGWLSLPGDAQHWPQEVKLDNQAALVSERDGVPSIFIQAGSHTLSGVFVWDRLPQALQIPHETGLVALTVYDQVVNFPDMDHSGKLWLQQRAAERDGDEDRLELKVYRRIMDEIPMMVITRIDLQVSGKQREILLGQVMTADYLPMSLDSPLPARLEPDGRLRVQVRPGRWSIVLTMRHLGAGVKAVTLPVPTGPWVEEEVWVFDARPHLRLVAVEGVPAIDPQQTTLPDDWRSLPAYRVRPGETLQIVEKKRGDPDPAPDQLTLERHLRLDFTGGGYTIQDHISGTMTRGWRLEMNPPTRLGRVAVDGQEQFITSSEGSERAGVEVRRGQIALTADSRLEGRISSVPAVGWEQDFHQLSGVLHLPPGWRVLAASGVDFMPDTWLQRWTLLDLFLVLIIALSIARLWGRRWGIVALVTLTLIYHEPDAPRWVWLHILAAVALLRVLPIGRVRQAVQLYRVFSLLALILIVVPFMVQQARNGLYPQLERPWQAIGEPRTAALEERDWAGRESAIGVGAGGAAPTALLSQRRAKSLSRESSTMTMGGLEQQAESYQAQVKGYQQREARPVVQYDPNAINQTGPGLPQWQWTTLPMRWSGPVQRDQHIHLVLIPPWANLFLSFLRVLLLTALVLCVLEVRYARSSGFSFPTLTPATTALLLLLLLVPVTSSAQGNIPTPELLDELRARLLEKPECFPQCATSPRLRLEIAGTMLRARIEIHSAANVAVPLPGQAQHWLPQRVLLNGEPARGLFRAADQLWIELPKGQHQIVMEGPLPNRDTVQLFLPLKPHRVEAQAEGWAVEGIHEDGLADDQLQFRRLQRDTAPGSAPTLEPATLPPFVRVERTLRLGLNWQVETRVVRMTPPGTAAVLAVPLLEGESVTSDMRVEGGKVLVNMAPQDSEVQWSSVLAQRGQLTLTAPDTTVWTEIWRLDVSPIWHAEMTGIPVVHHSDPASGYWLPEWHPWPGERVTLQITRPAGVPGQTLTVDSSDLAVTPGQRATDVNLRLSLRSSRGGQHRLTLPENARLQSVSINGQTQPIRQEGRVITLPLVPGSQSVDLLWQQPEGIRNRFTTPVVDLGQESVNAQIQIQMPDDRWILFTGGPHIGPAVFFWARGLVIVLVSVGLGRLPWTPLRPWHWMLLGIGLSPVSIELALLVVGWLLALGLRKQLGTDTNKWVFNTVQVGLAGLTLLAALALFYAIQQGLLGPPDMRIAGNGSSSGLLRWYQDRTGTILPQAWVFSVPLIVYRLLMLAWALWLAFALLRWLRWGWERFSENGLWRRLRPVRPATST